MSTGRPQATDPSDHVADARSAPAAGVLPDEPDTASRPDLVQDEEKPARQLTGWVGCRRRGGGFRHRGVRAVRGVAALSQGSQYYLILFLGGVLPLVFLSYRSGLRPPAWLPLQISRHE